MARPTAADAQLILKLYDLRREPEMRKARSWWLVTFWPMTADDIIKVASALGTDENAWFRQVTGYWDMAASFVNRGILNADLFLEGGSSGEMVFLFAKIQPILKETREKMKAPTLFRNVEKVIMGSKSGQERLKLIGARVQARRKAMAEGAKAS
jgi:hypothetical protein